MEARPGGIARPHAWGRASRVRFALFAVGTAITLRATNEREVIWSGACSSGRNKTKACTFTLNGNAAVTANVQ